MNTFTRASGILLHPTALSGPHGIGTLGKHAYRFIDWLERSGQYWWQICPLGPTGYGDSPYQVLGAFAGNPILIDLEKLIELGLLSDDDLHPFYELPVDHVDFGKLIPLKNDVLKRAWQNFSNIANSDLKKELIVFRESTADWLDDFTLFSSIKESQNGQSWDKWLEELQFRSASEIDNVRHHLADDIDKHAFIQFLFYRQWTDIKRYANEKGIRIIGDLPIFMAFDSADCWAKPELFRLDENRHPTHVAGVPPDYFSPTGQLWGNPLYDWKAMEKDGFAWWLNLLGNKLDQFDALRIDHFRGFAACWAIPYGEKTAVNGEWSTVPGMKLFDRVQKIFKNPPIIAEDLGVITDDVVDIMDKYGFPGMKVMQFAFDTDEGNVYLPHHFPQNCLVYTGTHDNDTTAGWYNTATDNVRKNACNYLNLPEGASGADVAQALIRTALASVADMAIFPLQDVLGLGSEARFNTPGVAAGNWTWRVDKNALSEKLATQLIKLTNVYGRIP